MILSLIVTIMASLLSMHLLSNRLVSKPKMGPRPMFVATEVAFIAFLMAMFALAAICLGELLYHP